MQELIAAAKAVIDCWDIQEPWKVGRPHMMSKIETLRAAVERAEKKEVESIKFDELFHQWFIEHRKMLFEAGTYDCAETAWQAAQQAERERCREIVITMGGPDVPELLKQIDSGEE